MCVGEGGCEATVLLLALYVCAWVGLFVCGTACVCVCVWVTCVCDVCVCIVNCMNV